VVNSTKNFRVSTEDKTYLNQYSLFCLPAKNIFEKSMSLYWFSTYLSFFLKKYTIVKINWQFLNLKLKSNVDIFIKLWRSTYKKNFLKNFFCSSWFYFYLLINLYCFKDIRELVIFFSKVIERYPLKYHKRLFRLFGSVFKEYLKVLYNYNKLLGFRLYFKGKLGKKGSVKKSTIYISGGKISYTNKMLRYNYKYFLIPTETGVVGCYLSVFYKKMFTYIYIYLTLYILTYFLILIYLGILCNFKKIGNLYLTTVFSVLKKYTNLSPAFFLFFLLTGLPPVGFFVIKFNILLNIYSNLNSLIQITVFLNILLTMFFYLQIFNTANLKITSLSLKKFKNNSILGKSSANHSKILFNFYLKCSFFIYFNILFIYYFCDIFIIYHNNLI